MNKLEQAIRKTADQGLFGSSMFSGNQTSCIEEIEKMELSYTLSHEELKKKKIIYPSMDNSKLMNSFRELRSSVTDNPSKNIVMVTALDPNSGTSFFAGNLASVIAFDSSKTAVLVDCNHNNSEVSNLFDIENRYGISDYVSNKNLCIDSIISESGVKRLRVVPFGSADTQLDEQFNHPRFHNLLADLKHKYKERSIVIDAPPILNSADTRILMNLCDQVVLVVPYGKVSQSRLEEALSILSREKLTGVVFNEYMN